MELNTEGYKYVVAVVRFFSRDDYYHVLEDDPWIVMRHYLTVARWKPNFRPSTDTIISTLDWVHFPEMPIELLTKIPYSNRNNGESNQKNCPKIVWPLEEKAVGKETTNWRNQIPIVHGYCQNLSGEVDFWLVGIEDNHTRDRPVRSSQSLREVIESCGFLDMSFYGPAYTWPNGRFGMAHIKERLDRA
ncbi:hypothetical protein M9H77_34739 [Catharanthus roseus]|uniref:Uncharacterized protein n=1 Tax=Catharanthus roseus TaxID=4058 RepID=A0ACB9ZNS3_CATRO|nr:hypothetical protein M9H77_34739 [Catharanthus roseus]